MGKVKEPAEPAPRYEPQDPKAFNGPQDLDQPNFGGPSDGSQIYLPGTGSSKEEASALSPAIDQAPVPVATYSYCLPTETTLELRSSGWGDCSVKDQGTGRSLFSIYRQNAFRDLKMIHDGNGTPLVALRQKVLTWLTTYKAFHPTDTEFKNELFRVDKKGTCFKSKYQTRYVHPNGNVIELNLKIGWLGQNGKFVTGDDMIVGTWERKMRWLTLNYISESTIRVAANVDLLPLISLCIAYEADLEEEEYVLKSFVNVSIQIADLSASVDVLEDEDEDRTDGLEYRLSTCLVPRSLDMLSCNPSPLTHPHPLYCA